MYAPIDASKQNSIWLLAKILDAIDDLNLPFVLQFFSKSIDAIAAFVEIRATALVSCHNPRACHVIRGRGIVEHLGERRNVRCVGTNNTDSNISGGRIDGNQAK